MKKSKTNNYYKLIYDRYKMLALNMFRWEGLPDTIKSRHIESSLYHNGLCIIINDDNLGFISVPCNYGANLNINNEPTEVITTGYNYIKTIKYMSDKEKDKCQLILNNDLGIGNKEYIEYFAQKMYEVDTVIRANINQQKYPWFIPCEPKLKNSIKLMFEKVDNLEPLILADKSIISEGIQVLTTNTPYVADKLNEYKFELEREILTFLGLNNNFEKKERLLTNEVDSNNQFIDANIEIQYKNRLIAQDYLNSKFGWNCKVIKVAQERKEAEIDDIELENDGYSKK